MAVVSYRDPAMLAAPRGAYSHVARAGGIVAVSGQMGVDRQGVLGDAFSDEIRQAFANTETALASEGLGFANVLKFTIYLVSSVDVDEFMRVRTALLEQRYPAGSGYPASTLVVVAGLALPGARVEIDVLAAA